MYAIQPASHARHQQTKGAPYTGVLTNTHGGKTPYTRWENTIAFCVTVLLFSAYVSYSNSMYGIKSVQYATPSPQQQTGSSY
jgi:hypothetical protein